MRKSTFWPRRRIYRKSKVRIHAFARGNGRAISLWCAILLGVGGALLTIYSCNRALLPSVTAIAEANVKNEVVRVINDSLFQAVGENDVSYEAIVTLQKGSDGRIIALTTNSSTMNLLKATILENITNYIEIMREETIGVPIGAVTGFAPLSGRGPDIPVRILSVASTDANFSSLFTSVGINQTLHQISLCVSINIKLLLAGQVVELPVDTQVNVCETIIVGDVPDIYLKPGVLDS